MHRRIGWMLAVLILTALPCPAPACTLCNVSFRSIPTFRLEAREKRAQLVLFGHVVSSKLSAGALGSGISNFKVVTAFKVDPSLSKSFQVKAGSVLQLPQYVPVEDKKKPPQYLVYAEIFAGKLDPFRAEEIRSRDVVQYLSGAIKLDSAKKKEHLLYYFQYLEHDDPKISMDAFLEFARASDQEVGAVAGELDASRLRKWLKSESTPPERLGLYAFLLGANGAKEDANLLRALIDNPTPRVAKALDGLLCGYALLEPKKGWELTFQLLGDPKTPVLQRMIVHRTLRFYHGWQPKKARAQILHGMKVMLSQEDLADVAVEDLRKWETWDLTSDVLALFGKGGALSSPLVQRTIVRYALSCPDEKAKQFVKRIRVTHKEMVEQVEEQLSFDRRR